MTQVVLVGVGALGSHVALLGRNLEVGLKVIDFDRVEQKNLLSQVHTKMGVGKNKAQALSQLMLGLYGRKVEAVPHRLTADNAEALLGGAGVVVECLDNAAGRRAVQALVRARGLPCLHGALAADGAFGRVVWDEHFVIDAEDAEGQATCEDGAQLPFIGLTAAVVCQSLQRFLVDGERQSFQVHQGGVSRIS
jgi:molybdopterin/thiamine biosynthesis adenylyltransferase